MNDTRVIMRARKFVRDSGIFEIPVDIDRLAAAANAKIKVVYDLADEESGQTTLMKGKHLIIVNGNHREERRRFTVLHELAHILLELPSQHHGEKLSTDALMSYRRRPKEEVLCDVFAAECLLPYDFFAKDVADTDISMEAVKDLAERYKASLTATGSRFAVSAPEPCAFVLGESERVRYVSSSGSLRELGGWISLNTPIPARSVAKRLIERGSKTEDYDEVASDVWFDKGIKSRPMLIEEAIILDEWDQCLSLLWFDAGRGPADDPLEFGEDQDPLLRELDGTLRWPSRRRR